MSLFRLKKSVAPMEVAADSTKTPRKHEFPVRILMGTSPGTKEDAESLARSQIERYFDTPDRSWFYLQEEKDVGVHYEIHEGGSGHALLPSLLSMERTPSEGVVIKPGDLHAIEVYTRPNRTLHSLVLPEANSREAIMSASIQLSSRRMRPYSTTGSEWIKVGIAALSIGVLMMTAAGVVHKSFSIAMNGYQEIAASIPSTRMLQLSGMTSSPVDGLPAIETLPVQQWDRLVGHPLRAGEMVSKLVYEGGRWDVQVKVAAPPPKGAPEVGLPDGAQPGVTATTEATRAATDAAMIAPTGVEHEVSHIGGVR